jgi:hypothetical protein
LLLFLFAMMLDMYSCTRDGFLFVGVFGMLLSYW